MVPCKPPLLLPSGVLRVLLFLEICFWTSHWLQIGKPLRVLGNIMLMRIYNMPIGSDVSMTTLHALGQQVLKKVHNPTKLGVRTEGPYTIECIHVNGNLTKLLCEGITERINICRVLPHCWTIPHTAVKTILSMDCIEVFFFYLWSFFLHLTFKWVVGGVFLGPVSVWSSMAERVLPWRGRVSCPWK